MKKPELLAPAGDIEAFYAAIEAGCDAVYLGGTHFGARAYSNNFNEEELKEAIKYAHIYGVKVYVTVNTIIYEAEVQSFMKYIDFLHKNNVDAVIMQDLGMMDLVRKTYPNLEIHASTQMHVHTLEGVKILEKLNVKRVVLARETEIETINYIKKNTNLELEVFIHGALCVCYSGECLISSLLTNRSGNRGTCSQLCRMPYDFIVNGKKINKDKYILSPKDLNTLENIPILMDIGVDSLKIEGRMKSKEYVYQVVSMYRMAIDSYFNTGKLKIDYDKLKQLQMIFNRNYTKGFLFHEKNQNFIHPFRPNHMGVEIGKVIESKNNQIKILLKEQLNHLDGIRILSKKDIGFTVQTIFVDGKKVKEAYPNQIVTIKGEFSLKPNDVVLKTLDKNLMDSIDLRIQNHTRKVSLKGKIECYKNQKIKLTVNDNKETIILYSLENVEPSKNQSIDKQTILSKMNKLGNTPYKFENLEVKMDDNIFIRLTTLNELKRQMVDLLNQKRIYQMPYEKKEYVIDVKEYIEDKGYSVLLHDNKYLSKLKKEKLKNIYIENIRCSNEIIKLPRIMKSYPNIEGTLLVGEIGSLKYPSIITDFSFNVVNSYTVAFLHSLGVKRVTLSYELNDYQINAIINNYKKRYQKNPNLELIIYSNPEVMITKFNLFDYYHIDQKTANLIDTSGKVFKVVNNLDYMTIYFYKKIILKEHNKYFDMGISTLRFHVEDEKDINYLNKFV